MIKGIVAGRGIAVGGVGSSAPYINMSNPSAGMVRYNGNNNGLEIYDGSSWYSIGSYMDLKLDDHTTMAIDWVYKKMEEERQLEELVRKYPTVAKAKQDLDMVVALTKDYNEQNISS